MIGSAAIAVTAPAHPAAAAGSAGSKQDSAAASALARVCHKRVSVSGATTSMSTLVANSDGSFTTTEATVPERVWRADGTWVAVDLTLKSNGDGTISPAASPTAVVLSDGGAGPPAKTVSGGQELVWTWTGYSLPKPSIDGAVTTYANVLPDVDLKVGIDEWGFSEVLVVKTRDAAANPNRASLKFALSGSGLSAGARPRPPRPRGRRSRTRSSSAPRTRRTCLGPGRLPERHRRCDEQRHLGRPVPAQRPERPDRRLPQRRQHADLAPQPQIGKLYQYDNPFYVPDSETNS